MSLDLRKYFEKIYVMNLDCCPERWDRFQEVAEKAGVTGFERYRAVHGDSCPHPDWWRCGNGAWGCLNTHLRIVQDALMDGIQSYLVFEDDVCFSEDFSERLPKLMKELSKYAWDQFYLGGQHLYRETCPPWPFNKQRSLLRCKNVNRTHAFAVNKQFMRKMQQHISHFPDYIDSYRKWEHTDEEGKVHEHEFMNHVDHSLGLLHQRGQNLILAADPWLCGQGENKSNISGQEQEEQWWHDKGWYQ